MKLISFLYLLHNFHYGFNLNTLIPTLAHAWSFKRNVRTLFFRENERWAFLDGYRAIGIFWVILGHTIITTRDYFGMEKWGELVSQTPIYFQWIFNGDMAVDGFLMVSGFLMTNILLKQYQEHNYLNVKVFYLSRFLRLTPAYYLTIIIFSLLLNTENKDVWPNFFYIQNFFDDYDRYLLPHSWSLAVEEQFYLLLPPYLLFILLKTKHPFLHLSVLLAVSLAIRAGIILNDNVFSNETIKGIIFNKENAAHYFVVLYDNLYTRFGAFIGGIAVAYAYRYKNKESADFLKAKLAGYITILSMLIAIGLCTMPVLMQGFELPQWANVSLNIGRRTVVCLCAAWLLFCGLFYSDNAKRFNAFMSVKFFHPFGHLLYSMYLFHYLAVWLVLFSMLSGFHILKIDYMAHYQWWGLLAAFLSIILTTIMAIFVYLLLEAPIMNLRPKLSSKK